jgi:hypothetical protein
MGRRPQRSLLPPAVAVEQEDWVLVLDDASKRLPIAGG